MKFYLALSILSISIFSYAQKTSAQQLITKEKVESLAQEYLGINPEATAVLTQIQFKDGTNWQIAKGHKSLAKKEVVKGTEAFIAASITKTFVATCLLKMEEQGKLSTSDLVIQYLDPKGIQQLTTYKGKSYEKELTLEDLLRHRSGIQDYLNEGQVHLAALEKEAKKKYSHEERINFALEMGDAHNKRGKYHYSNTNYILLAMVLEKIEGKTIAAIFDEMIIRPLDLKQTTLRTTDLASKAMLSGYYTDIELTDFSLHFNWMNAAGGLRSTQSDLIIFSKALFSGTLFEKVSTLEKMLTFKQSYALGVQLYGKSSKTGRILGHMGFDPGYTSYLVYLEDLEISLITTINQSEWRVVQPAFLIYKMVHEIKEQFKARN